MDSIVCTHSSFRPTFAFLMGVFRCVPSRCYCSGEVVKDTVGSAAIGGVWLIFTVATIAITNNLTDGRHD